MLDQGLAFFPVNFRIEWFSRHVHVHFTTAQARAKNCCRGPRARHFPWTFSHQTALLRCPCAFRLRRLAQTVILVRRSCGDPCEVLCKRSLHDLVQALVRRSWSKILWVSLHDFYRSFWEDLVEILFGSSLRGLASRSWLKMLCMILCRFLTEDLVEIRVRSSLRDPCMKILQMPYRPGACMKVLVGGSWEVLVSRSCKLRSSSRSFYDDLVSLVLLGCW